MGKVTEVDMVSEAIRGTEEEIMSAAMSGGDEDSTDAHDGDRSLEEMGSGLEGQADDDGNDAGADDDGSADGEGGDKPRDPKTGQFSAKAAVDQTGDASRSPQDGRTAAERQGDEDTHDTGNVPRRALLEERGRRQEAERGLEAIRLETTQQISAMNQRMDAILQALTTRTAPLPPPKEEKEAEQPIDFFENPDGYLQRAMQKALTPVVEQIHNVQQSAVETRHEMSMRSAHWRHKETFEKAFDAFQHLDPRNPADLQAGRMIANAPDPGEAMVDWFQKRTVLAEVGNDPTAYRQRVEKEVRDALLADPEFKKQMLDSMRAEAAGGRGNGQPRFVNRLPPSLNGSRGGSVSTAPDPATYDNSEAAVFDYVWDK